MFEDLVLGINNVCVDVFKTSKIITFQRSGLESTNFEGIFDENYTAVDPNTGAQIISTRPVLTIRTSDLPGGKGQDSDRFEIDGKTYRIEDEQVDSGGMIKLFLSRANA